MFVSWSLRIIAYCEISCKTFIHLRKILLPILTKRAPRTRWLSGKVRRPFPKYALFLVSLYFQGYEFREAVDGREGVHLYETDGQFEYVSLLRFESSGYLFTLPVSFCLIYQCQYWMVGYDLHLLEPRKPGL